MQKRQEKILSLLKEKGEITYKELCSLFPDVSEMTLRRDLLHLEGERQLIRIRGGAKPVTHAGGLTEAAYQQRLLEQDVQKKRIALLAQAYIEQARSLYIDSGTTCLYFARQITNQELYIVTPAPATALELVHRDGINLHLTGGRLNPETLTLSGSAAISEVNA